MHYVDMLEKMNYTGYWPDDTGYNNMYEFLRFYDELDAKYCIIDVNDDGVKELVVNGSDYYYRIYTYNE